MDRTPLIVGGLRRRQGRVPSMRRTRARPTRDARATPRDAPSRARNASPPSLRRRLTSWGSSPGSKRAPPPARDARGTPRDAPFSASGALAGREGSTPRLEGSIPRGGASVPRIEGSVPRRRARGPAIEGRVSRGRASFPGIEGGVSRRSASVDATEGRAARGEEHAHEGAYSALVVGAIPPRRNPPPVGPYQSTFTYVALINLSRISAVSRSVAKLLLSTVSNTP
jgi:hypothetical protein